MNSSNKCGLFASPMQTSMLLHSLLGHESQPYVQQFRWTFLETVNKDLLERAWKRVLKRHDTFYHTFEFEKGNRLRIQKTEKLQVEFKFLDWSHLPRTKRHNQLTSYLNQDLSRGFDPLKGNLSRLQLIRIHSRRSELVWTTHHALFDGRARLKLIQEFIEVYKALKVGRSVRLKKCPSYEEYLKWTEKQSWKSSSAFWTKQLEDLKESTALNFGMGFKGGKPSGNQQSLKSRFLSSKLSTRLSNWSEKSETSLNILGQAAWGMFLHLSTGQDTVMFGAPRACRKSNILDAESTVGLFVNTVPVIVKVNSSETVDEFTRRIQQNWVQLRDHENTPLPVIQRASNLPKNKPLFESLIGYEKYQLNQLAGSYGRSKYRFSLTGHTDIPFSIQLKNGDRIQLEVAYDNHRFSGNSVRQVLKTFIFLLEQLTTPPKRISEIELLDKQDRIRIRKLGTGSKPRIPTTTVYQAFERRASETPKATALRFNGQSTNYRSLNQQSNRLARYLKGKGVTPGDCVGILLERSEMPFIAQLAILKAGAYYLPLDPEYPQDRLKGMIKDAAPKYILTETNLRAKVTAANVAAIDLQSLHKRLQTFSARNLGADIDSDAPAYIMYTSGSTGQPKGVVVPHRAILRLVCKPNYVKLSAKTRCLQMATVSFDASTFEIWAPLLNGGCCVIYPERIPSIYTLGAILKKENVNTLWLTASLFNFVVDNAPEVLVGVKQLLAGGEALSPSHIRKAQKALPQTRLINGYGPTENTTFSCCYPIPKRQSAKLPVPIGPPISHSTCYVLNRQMKLLPLGSSGELYVGGDGVALGYLNNKPLTKSRFVSDPFSNKPLARLYKTGDRVYQKPNGNIEFLDRYDDQVKIRGFRIEPMEVQNRLQRIHGIQACAVLVRKNHREENELVAFSVLDKDCHLGERGLRKQLEAELPDYMIPSSLYFLPELPRSSSGKVDRKALLNNTPSQEPKKQLRKKKLNKNEKVLWAIWKDTLGIDPLHAEADFFDAGGHSLLATNFIHRTQTHFNLYISINDFYEHASIRKLAQLIERIRVASKAKHEFPLVIKPAKTKSLEPLSRTFQTTYNNDVVRPESTPTKQIVRAIELGGNLKPKRFLEALEAAINNHERYRTFTVEKDGEYFEKLVPHVSLKVKHNNFSKLSNKVVNQKVRTIYQHMCQEWVSVRDAPMFRVSFSKLPDKRYFFCIAVNHSICDGTSLGMLFRETSQAYNNLIRTGSASLKKPKFGFKEYEKSLQAWLDEGNEKRIQAFWKQKLHNLQPIDYPFLKKKLPDGIKWNEFDHYRLDPSWTKKIREFTEKNHISLYLFFLSLVKWMNARYTGQLDSYIASSANTRPGEYQEHIGGDFANVLLLRNELRLETTFVEQIKIDQATLYEAMDNGHIGMTTIAKPFRKGGLKIHKAGGQSRVSYAPNLESDLSLNGVNTKAWLPKRVDAFMRFGFIIREHGEELLVAFQHAPEIFVKHGLDRLKVNLQNLLKQLLDDPTIKLSELPDLTKPSGFKKPISSVEKRDSIYIPINYIYNEAPQKESTSALKKSETLTKIRLQLGDLWEEILKHRPDSLDEDFIQAGGHSLLCSELIYKIQQQHSAHIPLSKFGKLSTLRSQAEWIYEHSRKRVNSKKMAQPLPSAVEPATHICAKWKLYFLPELEAPDSTPSSTISRALLLHGPLRKRFLYKAMGKVINSHDRLRTHAFSNNGIFYEKIEPDLKLKMEEADYSKEPFEKAMTRAEAEFAKECDRPLSIYDFPLIRTRLLRIRRDKHLLILTAHHAIMDAKSIELFYKQTGRLYNQLLEGKPMKLEPSVYSFQQIEKRKESWLDDGNRNAINHYWKQLGKGWQKHIYPFLRKTKAQSTNKILLANYGFTASAVRRIKAFCNEHSVTPFVFLTSVIKHLDARYSGSLDSSYFSAVDTRKCLEEGETMGDFGNFILVRNRFNLRRPFLKQLHLDRDALYQSLENKSIDVLSVLSSEQSDIRKTSDFLSGLQISAASDTFDSLDLHQIRHEVVPRKGFRSNTTMSFIIRVPEDQLNIQLVYAPDRIFDNSAERIIYNLQHFTQLALEQPNLPLSSFPNLNDRIACKKPLTTKERTSMILVEQQESRKKQDFLNPL